MKKIAISVLVLLLLVGGGVFWLNRNIDGIVKSAIEKYGSEMTGAKVSVAAVEIKPGDGRGVIRGLTVGNPAGFKTSHLMRADEIEVVLDIASITGDVITVKKIGVVAPDIIYEKGDAMTNIEALQKNIADYLGPAEKKKDTGSKKLIVEELVIAAPKAQASAAFLDGKTVAVKLPTIALKHIGRDKGGVTPGELGNEIAGALKGRLSSAVSFDNLMKSAGKALDGAGNAIKGLFK
jgi:hypothetical protein